jgi:5-histidylcysteine sulfoxide synthase/putative 4-mercaptohistidine N1-methyltranferase
MFKNTKTIKLDNKNIKAQLLDYFSQTYLKYESLFELLEDDKIFYIRPNKNRHPLVFYFGHTAVFYINKLLLSGIILEPIDKSFERLFAIGVDEMRWDDLKNNNWPTIDKIRAYRKQAYDVVVNCITNMDISVPIKWDDDAWTILMGIEHENIHIETSSVLLRELDLSYIKQNQNWQSCQTYGINPKNSLIEVDSCAIDIARDINDSLTYGWDNEFGKHKTDTGIFLASKYLVSNGEFLEFWKNGCYQKQELWEVDGWRWVIDNDIKHPCFWIIEDDKISQRNLTSKIDLPLNWPCEVSYHEAKAFCNYISKRDNMLYDLPSEDEWHALKNSCIENINYKANVGIIHSSSVPVDENSHGKFYDVVGNVWQWCRSVIYPFDGFRTHKIYDDFTVPTFDDKHHIIKGGSWASCGNLSNPYSRYAFRKHFYQHSGFRYVVSKDKKIEKNDIYESDFLISQYCEFHYGDEYFGVKNFPKEIANIAIKYAENGALKRAFDIGCATGRCSFELSKYFKQVVGLDYSTRFIKHAIDLQTKDSIFYKLQTQGNLYTEKKISKDDFSFTKYCNNVEFHQGDAENLKPEFNNFDLIIACNLIDRLKNPKDFLQNIHTRVSKAGILLIASPYTWLENFTPKDNWLIDDKKSTESSEIIRQILCKNFTLLDTKDVEFVIRETSRKFQHSISEVSIWQKN